VRPQMQSFAHPYIESETRLIWSSELPLKESFMGVYIWILNLHNINTVIYIGQSCDVPRRLMQHYYSNNPTRLCSFWDRLNESKFLPCKRHNISCDCLPRFYIELIKIMCNDSFCDCVSKCERNLTELLRPITLNDDIEELDEWLNNHATI